MMKSTSRRLCNAIIAMKKPSLSAHEKSAQNSSEHLFFRNALLGGFICGHLGDVNVRKRCKAERANAFKSAARTADRLTAAIGQSAPFAASFFFASQIAPH